MTRTDFDEDGFDEEVDEEEDDVADDPDDMLVCPSCRRDVHEDTQQCPYCGDWITPVHAESKGKRALFIAAAVIVILGMLWVTTC